MERLHILEVKDVESMELALTMVRAALEEIVLSHSVGHIELWFQRPYPPNIQHPDMNIPLLAGETS